MAVTRIWSVVSNLSGVEGYICNPEKTVISLDEYVEMHSSEDGFGSPESLCLVRGINCSPKHAVDQFNFVKEQYDKANNPIQAYHGCISFAENEVTPKETVAISKEFVETVWGDNYQVLLAAHLNTNHLHCHFLINSVSYVDGHMLHAEKAWFIFREVADKICKKYGKSIIENPDRSHKKELTERESAAKDCIERAMTKSKNFSEFIANMQCEPCKFDFSLQNRSWTVLPDGWTVPVVTDKLGAEFTKEKILEVYPDSNNEVVRFTVPSVLERVDLKGYQSTVAEHIKSVISSHLIYSEDVPTRTYLPNKIKKEVSDMSNVLEVMIDKNITNKPMFDRFLLVQTQKLHDLRKRMRRLQIDNVDSGAVNSEIKSTDAIVRCLTAVKESFEREIVIGKSATVKDRTENLEERSKFI